MATFDPKLDKIGVFSVSLNAQAEATPAVIFARALAAGSGITLTPDPTTGRLVVAATGGGGGAGTATALVPLIAAGGTSTNITATYSPALTSYAAGMMVAVTLTAGIIGPTNFNPNGLGLVAMADMTGAALVNGYAAPGTTLLMVFSGLKWLVLNPSAVPPTFAFPAYPAIGSQTIGAVNGTVGSTSISGYAPFTPGTWVCTGVVTYPYVQQGGGPDLALAPVTVTLAQRIA
jgi:hypothetical protein